MFLPGGALFSTYDWETGDWFCCTYRHPSIAGLVTCANRTSKTADDCHGSVFELLKRVCVCVCLNSGPVCGSLRTLCRPSAPGWLFVFICQESLTNDALVLMDNFLFK